MLRKEHRCRLDGKFGLTVTFIVGEQSKTDPGRILTVLPQCRRPGHTHESNVHLTWYLWWVGEQVRQMPPMLFSVLPESVGLDTPCISEHFIATWLEVSRYLGNGMNSSIDNLVDHLTKENMIILDGKDAQRLAKSIVFAIIGWQTMLYRPDCGSCPLSQLSIKDELCGHRGQAHMALHQTETCCKRPLHEFLMGFGMLLPPLNFNAQELPEHSKAFAELRTVGPNTLNALLLTTLGRLSIRWTDCLACHLELDPNADVVYLFRYPSFCVANCQQQDMEKPAHGTLHACAKPTSGIAKWATPDEVSQLLEETLMSYRLFFGQSKASRRLFRALTPFERVPKEGQDALLNELCGRKRCRDWAKRPDREIYDLQHDFPILRSRIAALNYHLSARKPRTWKDLWRDKRDSAQWFTFWAVLIIGGFGLLFSFLQVVLQIAQLALMTNV